MATSTSTSPRRPTTRASATARSFGAAEPGAAGPAGRTRAWLQPREKTYGFEQQAGHTQVLMNAEIQKKATGWYCDVCECLLRDSASYPDHVNGKKHQRKLGYSMRTQRRRRAGARPPRHGHGGAAARRGGGERRRGLDTNQEYERILEAREADEAAKREAKKDAKKRKREEAAAAAAAEAEEDVDDEAAAMNAMMGFGSFGGGGGVTTKYVGGGVVGHAAPAAGRRRSFILAASSRAARLGCAKTNLPSGRGSSGDGRAREPPQLLPVDAALRPSARRLVAAAFGGHDHGLFDVRRRGDLAEALRLVFGGEDLAAAEADAALFGHCLCQVVAAAFSGSARRLLRVFEEAGRQRTAICTNLRDPRSCPLIALTARALQKLLLAFC